jgi:hypothetical protein
VTPTPGDHVGSERYLATLDRRIEQCAFPHPDPEAVPALTTARFVREAATTAGDTDFATAVRERREPVLAPVETFDSRLRELREDDATDRATVRRVLSPRLRTFLDYPAPPHDLAEAAERRGERRPDADATPESTHAEQRRRVRAVALGARAIAAETAEERGFADGVLGTADDERDLFGAYDSAAAYADTVGFNLGLAAESWLAADGEIPRAP